MATVVTIAPYRFLPARVGGQRNIALFYKYFSRHVELICLTVRSNSNELAEGYETIPFFPDSRFRYINLFSLLPLRRLMRQRRATHLMIEHPYLGWLAILLKKLTGVKLVVHSHNIEGLRFKDLGKWWWRLLWTYEKFVHRQADYNLFITEEDLEYATTKFGLERDKCLVVPYGIEQSAPPTTEERAQAKATIRQQYQLQPEDNILLFVGAFDYQPNLEAFRVIENEIVPLLREMGFPHKVFLCGPGLEKSHSKEPSLIITGYVDDISLYYKAADVFINPVVEGGGIKTKLVEALGYGCNVVSTNSGAIGVSKQLYTEKLAFVGDHQWLLFAREIIMISHNEHQISSNFHHLFYWKYIADNATMFIA